MMKNAPYPVDPNAPPYPSENPPSYPGPPPVGFQPVGAPPPPPGIHSPMSGYPVNASYVGSGYPQSGYPVNTGYAGTGYPPQPGYPGTTYPTGGYADQGYTTGPSTYVGPDDTGYNNTGILEDSTAGWTTFSDKAIRRTFVRKVYSILLIQLAFTTAVIALFIFEPHVKMTVQRNGWMYAVAYVLFLVLYFVLVCCKDVRRKWPTNMILLAVFTMSLSYLVGTISSYHQTEIVLMAMGICAACCLAITLFSFNTKYDITSCGGALFILCFVLFLFGILAIFTYNRILQTVYAALGALLFMLFLAYDTQMLMGGKKHELSTEEHIFAALQLYLDVVYIFIFILSLMGSRK